MQLLVMEGGEMLYMKSKYVRKENMVACYKWVQMAVIMEVHIPTYVMTTESGITLPNGKVHFLLCS